MQIGSAWVGGIRLCPARPGSTGIGCGRPVAQESLAKELAGPTFAVVRATPPVIMSRTVKLNPLLVSVLVAADIGDLVGGAFGGFVAAVTAIPVASAIQIVARDLWQLTEPEGGVEAARADQ